MKFHNLVKPNGTEVKVNENSLKHALDLGWKPKKASQEKKEKKTKKDKKSKDE